MSDFNLSDKIQKGFNLRKTHLFISDVREFIKRLKEIEEITDLDPLINLEIYFKINKLAGEKLC